jgi:hypothetical protein
MQTTLKAYSLLLTLYPLELRRQFGDEMTHVFAQQLHGAWEESGLRGQARVWLCAIGELLYVAVPAQLAQPVFLVPTLSLISNSLLFLALFQQLSPLAALGRYVRP